MESWVGTFMPIMGVASRSTYHIYCTNDEYTGLGADLWSPTARFSYNPNQKHSESTNLYHSS